MNFQTWLQTNNPKILLPAAEAVLKLTADGSTVAFIARYRKEQTGNLDEVAIQEVIDAKERWDTITKRQAFILKEIELQKKLTPELKEKILSTFELQTLEDLYLPYKQKRKSKASLAKEAGLLPLADWVWDCAHGVQKPLEGQTLDLWGFTFRNEQQGFGDLAAVLAGVQDILVERISEIPDLRALVRTEVNSKGHLVSAKGDKAKPNSKYEKYFTHSESIASLLQPQNSHRYLAVRRGWIEGELTLSITGGDADTELEATCLQAFELAAAAGVESPGQDLLKRSARVALKVHVRPSIEKQAHSAMKTVADEAAIQVFSANVRKLLLASPFGPKPVLGVDPGIRTGCKLALVDSSGKHLGHHVIHLQTDQQKEEAKKLLSTLFDTVPVSAVAVGNGTAGRETELFIRSALKEFGKTIPVVMVSEAGASVYSASEAAREEFPELDLTIRGAISIARRLQDPLAELVKTDPKSIGVGQYQHDVSPHELTRSLAQVVDSCVNSVGVNLNTASYHLLSHVSGIGDAIAKSIVGWRSTNGLFATRAQLLQVPHFSSKTFEQAAGFLRIPESSNPLDRTAIHPERYPVLERFATSRGIELDSLTGNGVVQLKSDAAFRDEVGKFTFDDIIEELEKPGRDIRESFVTFQFRDDIHELKDLKVGMICPGIVTNVTNFGAFVDIGVHQDGLVHLSQMSDHFVRDPREVVSPSDRVTVRVLEVNLDKNQIALTLRQERTASVQHRPHTGQDNRHRRSHKPPPRGQRPSRPSRPVFANNAFSVLAELKKPSKR